LHILLARNYWQEKLANGRTPLAPRLGRIIKPHYGEVSAGQVPPRAAAGEAFPLKRMRRNRDRSACAARQSSERRISGSAAVPCRRANPARAMTDATSVARPGETHLRAADRRALHQPGTLMRCRRDNDYIGPRRSIIAHRRGGFEMRAGRRERQKIRDNREDTMLISSRAADRACRVNDGMARRVLGPRINFRSDSARLWNRRYTLWRADRPPICRRNTIVH
jgi:hypothetical protein